MAERTGVSPARPHARAHPLCGSPAPSHRVRGSGRGCRARVSAVKGTEVSSHPHPSRTVSRPGGLGETVSRLRAGVSPPTLSGAPSQHQREREMGTTHMKRNPCRAVVIITRSLERVRKEPAQALAPEEKLVSNPIMKISASSEIRTNQETWPRPTRTNVLFSFSLVLSFLRRWPPHMRVF